MSCGQTKINSEDGDARWASRQIRAVAGPWRRVWKCDQALSAREPQGCEAGRGWALNWTAPDLLSLLRKLGLLQDLNVQSSIPDIFILFIDLAIGFVAFIEKQLFEGSYSTVLELDPSWSQVEPKLCCWLDKLFNLFCKPAFAAKEHNLPFSLCEN